MWWMLVFAIVAIAIGGIILYIVKGGLDTGGQNIAYLYSCKNHGGACREAATPDETCVYKSGCPDENGNGKIDSTEKGDYCCIPKGS